MLLSKFEDLRSTGRPILPSAETAGMGGIWASQNARLRLRRSTRDGSTSKASLCSLLRHATGGLEGIGGVSLCICGGRDSFPGSLR
jgi:hypothetical protein